MSVDLNYLAKIVGGVIEGEIIIVGGRSQGKSYFQDVFLHREDNSNTIWTFEILKERNSGEVGSFFIDDWKNSCPEYTLMKTSSKQSRYVRVWRNK